MSPNPPFTLYAVNVDTSVVVINKTLHDRQAKAGTGLFVGNKRIKEACANGMRDPWAVVLDLYG